MLLFQVENQTLYALSLQAEVAAGRTAAANDGQLAFLGIQTRLRFLDIDERPDDDVLTVVGNEPCRHGLQGSGKEQIQQQRLYEIVQMMAERNLGRAYI